MAEIRLTPEQKKVVDTRNCNLLVAAAAGSGKTAVLVKRIIKKVTEEGQDIDRLLIVTFTNAAAAEMRERIGAAIEEALLFNPEDAHLQRQMLLLHNAQITTIHSFCLDIIKSNFNTLGLDPAFRTGDPAEIELIKKEAIDNVFERFYESGDRGFLNLVSSYTKRTDSALLDVIVRIYDFSRTFPEPKKWLTDVVNQYKSGDVKPFSDILLKKASFMIQKAVSVYQEAVSLCDMDNEGRKFSEFLDEELNISKECLYAINDWDSAYEILSTIKFKTRSASYTKSMDVDIAQKCIAKRDLAKGLVSDAKKIITLPLKAFADGMIQASSYVETISSLVEAFSEEFSFLK